MTFFLIGYACGLKDKIKTVMRTLLAGVSVFILYTSSAHAQLVYLEDTSMPPVPRYLEKFLMMQSQGRASSLAYAPGNKAFFEGLKTQVEDLPVEDHLRTLTYIIDQLSAMSTEKVKETYNVDKNIVIALLTGIHDMAEKEDYSPSSTNDNSDDSSLDPFSNKNTSTKLQSNDYYSIEIKEYQGVSYYIYSLEDLGSIKQADFHGKHGGFHHCVYQQCDKVVFAEDMRPEQVYISFGNPSKEGVVINLNNTSHSITTEKNQAKEEDSSTTKKQVTTTPSPAASSADSTTSEDDLLKELNDIFGDIL